MSRSTQWRREFSAPLHALQNGEYDVLIADIGMPDRDGYWLIRAIRQGFEARRHISAIAATASPLR